jgi:hypothetical protein
MRDTNAAGIRYIANAIPPRIKQGSDLDDIYLSIDLDFMSKTEIHTRYDGGKWRREQLVESLNQIVNTKNVISADCLGYFGHQDAKSLLLYACVCAIITGISSKKFENLHDQAREGNLSYNDMYSDLGLDLSKAELIHLC